MVTPIQARELSELEVVGLTALEAVIDQAIRSLPWGEETSHYFELRLDTPVSAKLVGLAALRYALFGWRDVEITQIGEDGLDLELWFSSERGSREKRTPAQQAADVARWISENATEAHSLLGRSDRDGLATALMAAIVEGVIVVKPPPN